MRLLNSSVNVFPRAMSRNENGEKNWRSGCTFFKLGLSLTCDDYQEIGRGSSGSGTTERDRKSVV